MAGPAGHEGAGEYALRLPLSAGSDKPRQPSNGWEDLNSAFYFQHCYIECSHVHLTVPLGCMLVELHGISGPQSATVIPFVTWLFCKNLMMLYISFVKTCYHGTQATIGGCLISELSSDSTSLHRPVGAWQGLVLCVVHIFCESHLVSLTL